MVAASIVLDREGAVVRADFSDVAVPPIAKFRVVVARYGVCGPRCARCR